MHIVSVQTGISRPSAVASNKATAIVKEPVMMANVTVDGLAGDVIVDQKNHGGPDQAVYIYTQADYGWWEAELERTLEAGLFGENLTFSADDAAQVEATMVRIGDRYRIGDVLLEVTAPRIPCLILADRVGQTDFVRVFREAERPGMYCRVLEPGTIRPGDSIEVTCAEATNLGLVDAYRLAYDRTADLDIIREALKSPVSIRFREDYERRLGRSCESAED